MKLGSQCFQQQSMKSKENSAGGLGANNTEDRKF